MQGRMDEKVEEFKKWLDHMESNLNEYIGYSQWVVEKMRVVAEKHLVTFMDVVNGMRWVDAHIRKRINEDLSDFMTSDQLDRNKRKHKSIFDQALTRCEILLKTPGLDANARNSAGNTLAHLLCCAMFAANGLITMDYLLRIVNQHKLDLNMKNKVGKTPWQLAIHLHNQYQFQQTDYDYSFIVSDLMKLVRAGANLDPNDVKTLIGFIRKSGKDSFIEELNDICDARSKNETKQPSVTGEYSYSDVSQQWRKKKHRKKEKKENIEENTNIASSESAPSTSYGKKM